MTDGQSTGRWKLPRECRRIAALLPALPDGDLRPAQARRVEAHLAVCNACRREAKLLLGLGDLVRQSGAVEPALPTGDAAASWIQQASEAQEPATQARGSSSVLAGFLALLPFRRRMHVTPSAWALGAALVAVAALGLLLLLPGRPTRHASGRPGAIVRPEVPRPEPQLPPERTRPQAARPGPAWNVTRLAGAPRSGSRQIRATGRLKVGEWLETDNASRARIHVADIGDVEVQPNTRIRLVATRPGEHRLSMARGGMRARINAPPRLFFVETPSAVAVDLGCAYTLNVDENGRSVLHVTSGWVALVRDGRESIVAEGARCETRPGLGLGTPYQIDASLALREALADFDFAAGGARALDTVLAAAQEMDSLTLWHLLSRAAPADRDRVFDRLTILVPPPSDVTRAGILRLDRKMLDRWREEIEFALWSADMGLPR